MFSRFFMPINLQLVCNVKVNRFTAEEITVMRFVRNKKTTNLSLQTKG